MTWCCDSGWPKVRRSRAQARASSVHTCAYMQAMPAIINRSLLKLAMMARKPSPSAPSRFATGTRQPSKRRCAVSLAHQPVFFSGERVKPGVSPSITSSETPPAPRWAGSVRTATVRKSARTPLVMKVFSPSTT